MAQAKGYHGADNAKYKLSGSEGTVTAMPYLKSVSLNRQINSTSQYANNREIIKISTDNGYTGNLGTTARDTELEKALGMIMPLSGGTGVVSRTGGKRLEGFYYEYKETDDDGDKVIKVWLLNVELTEPSLNNSTDTDSVEFGEYVYPITVYGTRIKDSAGTADYVDERGNKLDCFMVISAPEDEGYDTFDATVPVPKAPTA